MRLFSTVWALERRDREHSRSKALGKSVISIWMDLDGHTESACDQKVKRDKVESDQVSG
jgi:hypothetical protein